LQVILSFKNPDFHGILSTYLPKFLHRDTEWIYERQRPKSSVFSGIKDNTIVGKTIIEIHQGESSYLSLLS